MTYFEDIKYERNYDEYSINEIIRKCLEPDPKKRISIDFALTLFDTKEIKLASYNFKLDTDEKHKKEESAWK